MDGLMDRSSTLLTSTNQGTKLTILCLFLLYRKNRQIFTYTTRLSYFSSCDCEAICTCGEATFLIQKSSHEVRFILRIKYIKSYFFLQVNLKFDCKKINDVNIENYKIYITCLTNMQIFSIITNSGYPKNGYNKEI